jgi:uncharacterized protein DUF6421
VAYLAAVGDDLRAWVDGGFERPDFTRALDAFHPERDRRDGVENLVFFPMYKQNGSRDWTDNRLTIEWERVADGVASLHGEVQELYRAGIDRTKLQHWAAAHDLVAASVAPAAGSRWAAAVREFEDIEEGRTSTSCSRTSSRCRSSTAR